MRLRDGRLRIRHEHVTEPAEDAVDGVVLERDVLGVELAMLDVPQPELCRAPASDLNHGGREVARDEAELLAQERSGREARVARPRRELEHGVARLRVERSTIHSVTGRVVFSISARRRSQPDAIVCQFSSAVRLYCSGSTLAIVDVSRTVGG